MSPIGLDHHIEAERYVDGGWPWIAETAPEKAAQYRAIMDALELTDADVPPAGVFVRMRPITWRKINAAHGWVIDHCWSPDKDDNCVPIPMSREDLTQLRDDARLSARLYRAGKREDASLVMKPMGGFFFGNYEIDDWYLQDMDEVDTSLTALLDNPKFATDDWSFQYYCWY